MGVGRPKLPSQAVTTQRSTHDVLPARPSDAATGRCNQIYIDKGKVAQERGEVPRTAELAAD